MYDNIVKIAREIIAKNQSKKLLEYLLDGYSLETIGQTGLKIPQEIIDQYKNKIKQIQQKSFNFTWFVHRFIQQNKHYQDVQDLLKVTKAYSKLNKELRTFDFNDNKSFSDFYKFMQKYLNKNVKNNQFKKPTYCKLVHSDGKYNYYYADAKDKKCFEDLHQCNTKADGHQYAMWCVVKGTVSWGDYTTSQFPFYVYVTDKKNTPVMLFNFGYNRDCQIKDIHDNAFTQYDEQLLTGIKKLAKDYNFDIAKNEYDFKAFNQIDKLYNKQLDELNIDSNIISESKKYNGLNFIQQNIIYDFKKNKKAYLIANGDIVNLQSYKINLYLLNLLKDKKYINSIARLAENDKFLSSCSQQIFTFIVQALIDNGQYRQLYYLIKKDKIKDKNKVNEIIQALIDNKECDYLCSLISFNKIEDENIIKQIVQVLIDDKMYGYLYDWIVNNKIKDENIIKQIIKDLIDNKQYYYLSDLIKFDVIEDENIVRQIIQFFIDDKEYDYLYNLIGNNKIKNENQLKQIIQALIDNKQYNYLYYLINIDKIKDKNIVKQIVKVLSDNKKYYYLYSLIEENKINQSLLTQEQKEFLKKEYPDIRLSKKLVKIAKILKG